MLASTCSRLAVKPFTGAGMLGARQLSLAKLAFTQAGVERPSISPLDLQIGAKGLSPAGTVRDIATAACGCGVAFAPRKSPAAAAAATSTSPVPIHFSITQP